ncbi:hypothetical protein EVAR_21391_1 [Eumeta japonica]|uniref:Uncharacterized protein n=1 Tax=Eumeta variegata TaxID=151549 RepID=A0A4C1VG40_EUMVA|nr:hypothetical protein EVAR_21391_1 [Eumeta japonica]
MEVFSVNVVRERAVGNGRPEPRLPERPATTCTRRVTPAHARHDFLGPLSGFSPGSVWAFRKRLRGGRGGCTFESDLRARTLSPSAAKAVQRRVGARADAAHRCRCDFVSF